MIIVAIQDTLCIYIQDEFPAAEVRAGHTGWRSGPPSPDCHKRKESYPYMYISRSITPESIVLCPVFYNMQSGIPDSKKGTVHV